MSGRPLRRARAHVEHNTRFTRTEFRDEAVWCERYCKDCDVLFWFPVGSWPIVRGRSAFQNTSEKSAPPETAP